MPQTLVRPPRSAAATGAVLLACHRPAAFGALSAGLNAILHSADALAVLGTFGADLGAFLADVLMVGRVQQHEMRRGPADFGAGHHQAEMRGFGVLASDLQAMGHRHAEARLLAAQAVVDAALHVLAHLHGSLPLVEVLRRPKNR